MRRRVGLLATVLGLALVAAAAVRFAPATIGGGTSYVVVADSSMEPALFPGDLALVQRRDSYELGDIVAVRAGNGLVPRRVISVGEGALRLKADAGEVAGRAAISSGAVVGALVATIPAAGHALRWLRTPRRLAVLGLSLGLCSLALLVVVWPRRGRASFPGPGPTPADPRLVFGSGASEREIAIAGTTSLGGPAGAGRRTVLDEHLDGTVEDRHGSAVPSRG